MEETKIQESYTRYAFGRKTGASGLEDWYGYVEGYFKGVNVRSVNTKNGPAKIADIRISAKIGDRKVEQMFGKEFVKKDHWVNFKITYWGYLAEYIEQHPFRENQRVIALISNMKTYASAREDGQTWYTVEATGDDRPQKISYPAEAGKSPSGAKPEMTGEKASAAVTVKASDDFSGDGFSIIDPDDFQDEDAPF